jgi:hypothetical protein
MKVKDFMKKEIYSVWREYTVNYDTWEDHHDHKKTEHIAYAAGKQDDIEAYFIAKYPNWKIRVGKLDVPYDADVVEINRNLGRKSKKINKERNGLEKKIESLPKV